MKRYYLSKIFQDVNGDYGIAGAWHHGLQKYPNVDYVGGEIAVDPDTGIPTQKVLLCLVGGVDHTGFKNDPDLAQFPVIDAGMKVTATATVAKLQFKAKAKGLGVPEVEMGEVLAAGEGWRDVLNHFGKKNNPAFDADNFDVDES